MIAAWMMYTAAVTLLLFAGASAAEYVARALGAPTRLVWAAAMVAAVGLSARALDSGLETRQDAAPAVRTSAVVHVHVDAQATGAAQRTVARRPDMVGPSRLESFLIAARTAAGIAVQSAEQIDVKPLERWNGALLVVWATASLVAFSWLAGALVGLRRIEHALAPTVVDDQPVLVSKDVGPALFGILRSRIVLPKWVLALPKGERDVIVAHEQQHARAFDPALVYAMAFVVALQPWNFALWALFARLRLALEADCDRRVLGATGDARRYGRLLVTVYERTTPRLTSYVAFVERPSNLERRIRRITRRPRMISIAGLMSALATVVVVTTAWTAAPPVRHATPPEIGVPKEPTPARRLAPMQTVAMRPLAAAPAIVPPTLSETVSSVARKGRCSFWEPRYTVGQIASSQTASWGWGTGGCSIYGDIVVVAVDSSRVLVAARDTADVGVGVTAFFVFATTPGSVPLGLAWSTTTGHAELSDTTLSFSSAAAGTKPLVMLMPRSATGRRNADAVQFPLLNMMLMQMKGVAWDVIVQLPTAERCPAIDPSSQPIYIVDGLRQDQGPDGSPKACFIVHGNRVEIPIP